MGGRHVRQAVSVLIRLGDHSRESAGGSSVAARWTRPGPSRAARWKTN